MFLAVALAMFIGATPESVELERRATRLHAAVGGGATAVLAGFALGVGPGLTAELGVTIDDRFTLAAHGNVGTVFSWPGAATVGLGLDVSLTDWLSVGVTAVLGAAFMVLGNDFPQGTIAGGLLHVQFGFASRSASQVSRSGLKLFLEGGPGAVLSATSSAPVTKSVVGGVGGVAALGLVYAW